MNFFRTFFILYKEGFANLKLGKTLWKIVFLKLLIMLVVFKFFFFSTTLHTHFLDDAARSNYVLDNLIKETP
ncbi:MAG: DUF4492 domain-containing protein [Epsilonproteobacteria bacterium]|nr:DUF4492 domain-containing protein [Campylobacterota bacterium]